MSENKIKNLEMIQAIISRMANNSFLLKGWSITIVSGMFSLNYVESNPKIYLLIFFIVILFWALDSYYLQLEREYRNLYNYCLKGEIEEFNLQIPSGGKENKISYLQVLLSKTEMGFYLLLVLIISVC